MVRPLMRLRAGPTSERVAGAERVLEVLDDRRTLGRPDYAHHVEAAGAMLGTLLHEVIAGGVLEPAAFVVPDGVVGLGRSVGRTGLDLDENDGVSIKGNKVYLSGGAPVVGGEDAMPSLSLQKPPRRPFAAA